MAASNKAIAFAFFVLVVMIAGSSAFAQDRSANVQPCALTQLASLDISELPSGFISVPVSVAGAGRHFIVNLAGISAISDAFASELKLRRNYTIRWNGPLISVLGMPANDHAVVPDFQIGLVHSAGIDMLIAGEVISGRVIPFPDGNTISGAIGTDILQRFDVEFDFKSSKMNLYRPVSCGANVVFWANSFASVPFELSPLGTVVFHMQLDGRDVTVQPILNKQSATMGMTVARTIFSISDNSPSLQQVSAGDSATYRYPFKSLSIGGLAINNPAILLYPDKPSQACQGKSNGFSVCMGRSDMTIGLSELRALHMFFSFSEKMVYLTSADAHL